MPHSENSPKIISDDYLDDDIRTKHKAFTKGKTFHGIDDYDSDNSRHVYEDEKEMRKDTKSIQEAQPTNQQSNDVASKNNFAVNIISNNMWTCVSLVIFIKLFE